MFGLGIWELVVILVVVVIVFGAGRLPELGSGLGEGIKNFKKAYRDSKSLDVGESNEPTQKGGEKGPTK